MTHPLLLLLVKQMTMRLQLLLLLLLLLACMVQPLLRLALQQLLQGMRSTAADRSQAQMAGCWQC
jgi:DMSO/TMAO reductase YedYZ heme-binding membrane subunit